MNHFYKLINWLRKQTTQPARQNIDYEKLYLIAELEKLTIINKQLYQNMINNKIVLNVNYGGDMYTGDTEHTINQAKQHDSTEYTDYEEVSPTATNFTTSNEISKLVRYANEYVKGCFKGAIDSYFLGEGAQLALIEATFYDHGQLLKRNNHLTFLKCMQAWGILSTDLDVELMANCMSQKMRKLPESGYLSWGDEYDDDRAYCKLIASTLPSTMPYIR